MILIIFFFSFLISFVYSKNEQENKSLSKETSDIFDKEYTQYLFYMEDKKGIKYNHEKIDQILDNLGIPRNYNFIKETQANVIIKNQRNCGSCWSFAITTALSYRFHKLGKEVNLSPQYALSCFKGDCEGLDNLDGLLSLVRYGIVSDECLPYHSYDGKVEKCPNSCVDGSKLDFYYAKNAYKIEEPITENNYYDIVKLIFYQLYNYGPVIASIDIYKDFELLDNEECGKNDYIYSYDGKSEHIGKHAVSIVGFGKTGYNYYWIVQNSYGDDFCDNGFIKINFGEIGIETASFIEPSINTKKAIDIEMVKIKSFSVDEECEPTILIDESDINKMEQSFIIKFKNINNDDYYYAQCGLLSTYEGKKVKCYQFFTNGFPFHNGLYKFSHYEKTQVINIFKFDNSIKDYTFKYYGDKYNFIRNYNHHSTYITSNSRIAFSCSHSNKYYLIPEIYANIKAKKPLSNCNQFKFENNTYIYCQIKTSELEDFKLNNNEHQSLVYTSQCGKKISIDYTVYVLDKTKYPIFYFNKFILQKERQYLKNEIDVILEGYIDGNISEFEPNKNEFSTDIIIDVNSKNDSFIMTCKFKSELKIDNLNVNCKIPIAPNNYTDLHKFYFPPTGIEKSDKSIFEVIILDDIEFTKQEEQPDKPDQLNYSNLYHGIFLIYYLVILLLLQI